MFEQKSIAETIRLLNSSKKNGLAKQEAEKRLKKNGTNTLVEEKIKSYPLMFLEQLNNPLIYILIIAAFISSILGEFNDSIIIIVVIFINALIGILQEGKAQKALQALKKLTSPTALVKREGTIYEIPAAELVPGDIVCLEAGRQIPADLRLTESINLKIEEASLTGESLPVEKSADFTAKNTLALGDKINIGFMSTNVVCGRGEGVVIATGMQTEIGKIADSINKSQNEPTPLQLRLADLGKFLSIVAIIICFALFLLAIFQKRDVFEMLLTAISLAVAAVPEGLPAVVTIVLALSVSRMVKINTIIRKLPAVETLGSVNIVCSDKTGTLTQNKMCVLKCFVGNKIISPNDLSYEIHSKFIDGFVLCNDAIGDPTEMALIDMGNKKNVKKEILDKTYPRIAEIPFDSDRKSMSTLHRIHSTTVQYTKGSVEQLLKMCSHIEVNDLILPLNQKYLTTIENAVSELSAEALRILGLAYKTNLSSPQESDLIFLGFAGMMDPIRPEAREAIETFKNAGIRTIMITGDHQNTALAIAKQLHIAFTHEQCLNADSLSAMSDEELLHRISDISVISRVSPEHKTRIVRILKSTGNIVAMTGDGVNDAPSLKAADIGIAMGKSGTDVAKNAADIILTDDNFATIKKAIEEGRGIYSNIKKSVLFLLSSNFGEIITMFLSVLLFLPTPLKPIHILWVNLITDTLPALALGTDKNDSVQMMQQPPRPSNETLFAHGGIILTLFYGCLIACISLIAFLTLPICIILRNPELSLSINTIKLILDVPPILTKCQTFAFTVLGISQLFHAIGMRNTEHSIFFNTQKKNLLIWFSLIIGFVLQLTITEIPYLCHIFGTSILTLNEWLGLISLSVTPLIAHELILAFKLRR